MQLLSNQFFWVGVIGADAPVIGSEHFHIANGLSKADLKWMYSLPWYISSKELNSLFVHAGFVSGIRLGKQNPRLMMNMRYVVKAKRKMKTLCNFFLNKSDTSIFMYI